MGTPVSQNNVAKEAGVDPSALKKARYPSLVKEIQDYVAAHQKAGPSLRQIQAKKRGERAVADGRLEAIKAQRDDAHSRLLSSQRAVLELLEENRVLRSRLAELSATVHPFQKE